MSAPANQIGPSDAPVSPERRSLVQQARQSWIRKLIDLSRRNNLLYFRPLKTGTLDLSSADQAALGALLSGDAVAVNRLLANEKDESLVRSVRDIARRALENAEEKGLQTLFLALGMATWPAEDGGRPVEAPVLLLPVEVESKGQGGRSFSLKRSGSPQINLVLLHVLDAQFGIKISAEDVIGKLLGDDEGEPFDLNPLFSELRARASDLGGFEIKMCAILGNFAFQKLAMVKDLQERPDELAVHDLIAAIAGDSGARSTLGTGEKTVDPNELDRAAPDNEFIVLDADSSQQCAIAGVVRGQNAVVHGPPGTGKSQTIVNLIASLAAAGRRVLFVAEKRAALDVVLRRLNEVGLGHLTIDLHGADLSPKKVMQDVARTLDIVRGSIAVSSEKLHSQFEDRRNRLNGHVHRMHSPRPPVGRSVYQMQGALLRLPHEGTANTRWRGGELSRLTPEAAEQIRDLLLDAAGFASLFLRTDASPWAAANLLTGESVQRALDLVARMTSRTFPQFVSSIEFVLRQGCLRRPESVTAVKELCRLLTGIQGTMSLCNRSGSPPKIVLV